MSTDFLKIAQAHVASTGADPRIVISEMEDELEKVASLVGMATSVGKAFRSFGSGAKSLGARIGSNIGAAKRGMGAHLQQNVVKPLQDIGTGFRAGKSGVSFGQQGARDTMRKAMPAPPKATPSQGGLNPGSTKTQQIGVPDASAKATPAPGAPPDATAPAATGMQVSQQSEAQASAGPGFMQKHFGLTPGHDDGILGGKGVGKWWEGTTDDQKLKIMGAAGAGAAGAGYMLGGSGGGRTQVIYS